LLLPNACSMSSTLTLVVGRFVEHLLLLIPAVGANAGAVLPFPLLLLWILVALLLLVGLRLLLVHKLGWGRLVELLVAMRELLLVVLIANCCWGKVGRCECERKEYG
jgi:hypothetical protein